MTSILNSVTAYLTTNFIKRNTPKSMTINLHNLLIPKPPRIYSKSLILLTQFNQLLVFNLYLPLYQNLTYAYYS